MEEKISLAIVERYFKKLREHLAVDVAVVGAGPSGMVKLARESEEREFIVGTEVDMTVRLRRENPGKKFYPASDRLVCPNMKKTTLEKVLWSLEEMRYPVTVPEEIRLKALKAVEAMVSIS